MAATETQVAPKPLPVVSSPTVSADNGELRTSNEVDGFVYSRPQMIWQTFLLFCRVPFFPFWPFFIAYEAKDWSIARNYFGTLWYCMKVVVAHIRFGSMLRLLKYNLFMNPEEMRKRIDLRRGACSRCAKCCKQFDCIFLGQDDQGEYICKVYRTTYWYYGTCGRYPLEQIDIDYHACPGFSFADSPEAAEAA